MREIKFRAWDGERLRNVNTIGWVDEGVDFVTTPRYSGPAEDFRLMQYTALKDKNGAEVYEGDVVSMIVFEDNAEYLGYVFFENGCFCLNISLDGTKYKVPASAWKETETIITVIGNIYENPELLEREAE